MLVGHVDNSNIPTLRKEGGDELVQKMALEAMDLSKPAGRRNFQKQLVARLQIDPKRPGDRSAAAGSNRPAPPIRI